MELFLVMIVLIEKVLFYFYHYIPNNIIKFVIISPSLKNPCYFFANFHFTNR